MHNRFDQYMKNLLRETLSYVSKQHETEVEVIAATQKIDVYAVPDPDRADERKELGWLGELSDVPTMFELFSTTPNLARFRLCIKKQLSWHGELERRARVALGDAAQGNGEEKDVENVVFPRLLVVSPGRPETVLQKFGARKLRDGVYELDEGLCAFVVVLSELPRERRTLLLRLMGRDRVLDEALEDLKALPPAAQERCVVLPLLLHFRFEVENPVQDEQAMSAEIEKIKEWYKSFVEEQQLAIKKALDDGISQGMVKGERALLVRQLRGRFGSVPAATIARIEAADATHIERWGDRVLTAQTLDEVFGEAN